VLNAPTYDTTLAPNDNLLDPNFCNQCKPKVRRLKLASKNFNTTRGFQKKPFFPKHLIRYAPKIQDT